MLKQGALSLRLSHPNEMPQSISVPDIRLEQGGRFLMHSEDEENVHQIEFWFLSH